MEKFDVTNYSPAEMLEDPIVFAGPIGPAKISEHMIFQIFGIYPEENVQHFIDRKVEEVRKQQCN